MDISRYLAELIRNREELVVPGLGTFFKQEIPARFDEETQQFLPPAEKIEFITDFQQDDVLLNYIAQHEKTSLESINEFVEQYVNNLNELLNSTESIRIDALGTFEQTKGGFLFVADQNLISNKYYGLKPQPELNNTPREVLVEEIEQEESEVELEDNQTESHGKRNFLLILAMILCLIAILQVIYPDFISTTPEPITNVVLADTLKQTQDTIAPVDSLGNTDTTLVKKDTTEINLKTSENVLGNRFEIIIAAFGRRAEADDFLKQLNKRGIEAYTLPNKSKEFIKVSVGGFEDEQAATNELKRIQSEISKSAWIYRVKPKKQNK